MRGFDRLTSVGVALRRAAPALAAFIAVRVVGLVVLQLFTAAEGRRTHRVLVSWDAQWYRGIAANGYGFVRIHADGRHLSDYAFFPLYPWLERVVADTTSLSDVDAGLLVSWLASIGAAWGIFAVADQLYGRRVGLFAVVLWASLPVSIVLSMAYSEALFTSLAAWSLYATLTNRWLVAGVLASLAGMTRPVGAAVVAAVLVSAALALVHGSTPQGRGGRFRILLGAAIAPLGWLGYVGWVAHRTGDTTGYFDVTDGWGNGFDGGRAFASWVWRYLDSSEFVLGLLICLGLALLLWLYALCIRERQPAPLLVYGGLLVLIAVTTSGYFGSKPRYLLPAFSLLFPVARWLGRQRMAARVSVVGLLVVSSVIYGGVWLLGPGPP